jgi:xylulose-5-phosphate/fructose-6-phosphate phosphoketolase
MKTNQANVPNEPLAPEPLERMNAYWRAANYLSVGQIYLYDNPRHQHRVLSEGLKQCCGGYPREHL